MRHARRLPSLFVLLFACAGDPASPAEGSSEATGTSGAPEPTGGVTGSGSEGTSSGSGGGSEGEGSSTGAPVDPLACWTDLEVGEAVAFYEGFVGGSEGIAFGVDGLLYATTDGIVWRLTPAGEAEQFAEVPDAVGLAPWAGGDLVVASFGVYQQVDGAVYTVTPAGVASHLADGIKNPNFVAIAGDGSAFVSDDFDTRVFRVTAEGEVSVALDVPSPNGMAYGADGSSFYVASTFTDTGQLTRYDVDAMGLPVAASAREILQLGFGSTPDGIAVDEQNRVYVAANLLNQIWRVDGNAETVQAGEMVSDAVQHPASIAFGRGPDYDPCSIYVTELDGDRIVRIAIGARGAPLFL